MNTIHTSARYLRLLPALLLVLTLAACGDDDTDMMAGEDMAGEDMAEMHDDMDHDMDTMPGAASMGASSTGAVRMEDGVQVAGITVGRMGYEPNTITLEAGVPARLVFTRTVEGDCPSQVQVPAFGVEPTSLPMEEPTAIEFTPDEAGTFTFVCGMGMMEGALVVEA